VEVGRDQLISNPIENQLVAYHGGLVSTEHPTWGAVQALYR
jgi:hypothetical protein